MTDSPIENADGGALRQPEIEARALIEAARREAHRILAEGTTRAAALRAEAAGARYEARQENPQRSLPDPSSDPFAPHSLVDDHELHAIEAQDSVLTTLSRRLGPSPSPAGSSESTESGSPVRADEPASAKASGLTPANRLTDQPRSLLGIIDMESSRQRGAFFVALTLAVMLLSYGFLAA